MKSMVWGGKDLRVSTLLNYSDGRPHGALDICTPVGTELYSPFNAIVIATHDGVKPTTNKTPRYPGMPSNYVVLDVHIVTNYHTVQKATILFNHLSKVYVKTGQKINKGHLLGLSGNSGNSTGPHTHIGAQWTRRGTTATVDNRYDHIKSEELRIWPPTRFCPEV